MPIRPISIQGVVSGPSVTVMVSAPPAARRHLIETLTMHVDGDGVLGLVKKVKAGIDHILFEFDTSTAPIADRIYDYEIAGGSKGDILLGATDETLEIEVTLGASDVHFVGVCFEID